MPNSASALRALMALGLLALASADPAHAQMGDTPPPTAPPDYERIRNFGAPPAEFFGSDDMPSNNPRVAPVLAAHPDKDLVICLAGCGNGPAIVQIRLAPKVAAATTAAGRMLPTAGNVTTDKTAQGRPGEIGDVVCLAGCAGEPGEVVHRNVRLSWLSDEGRDELRTALRNIAARLLAPAAPATPAYVPAEALAPLMEAMNGPARFAARMAR